MPEPIVDPKTGVVTFPKADPKTGATAADMQYVAIPKGTMANLAKLAKADGFNPDATSEQGKAIQTSKAARTYVLLAIQMLLDKRQAASK